MLHQLLQCLLQLKQLSTRSQQSKQLLMLPADMVTHMAQVDTRINFLAQ
jgi:hypothetical protein